MSARRCARLRFLLYFLGSVACIARFIYFAWDLPPALPLPPIPTTSFTPTCGLHLVPSDPTSFQKSAPVPRYPYWNADALVVEPVDSLRCNGAADTSFLYNPQQQEQLRALWLLGILLGRTVVMPDIMGVNPLEAKRVLESIWSLKDMSHAAAFVTPVEFAPIRLQCNRSTRTVPLHFADAVISDGIPGVQVTDNFVMNAEMAAIRRQEGRNASSIALHTPTTLNAGDLCLLEIELDRAPPSFYLFSRSVGATLAGLETHYMHFTPAVFELAFRAITSLLLQPYAAVSLALRRSPSDSAWRQLEQEPLAEKAVYIAGDDPGWAGLASTLRAKGATVRTASELAIYLRSSGERDPLVFAAVEQVLLAAATSFYFTPDDFTAAPVIALRERLGVVGAEEDRKVWETHTRVSVADRTRLQSPLPKCESGPEE